MSGIVVQLLRGSLGNQGLFLFSVVMNNSAWMSLGAIRGALLRKPTHQLPAQPTEVAHVLEASLFYRSAVCPTSEHVVWCAEQAHPLLSCSANKMLPSGSVSERSTQYCTVNPWY